MLIVHEPYTREEFDRLFTGPGKLIILPKGGKTLVGRLLATVADRDDQIEAADKLLSIAQAYADAIRTGVGGTRGDIITVTLLQEDARHAFLEAFPSVDQ